MLLWECFLNLRVGRLAFIFAAKGERKLLFWNELIANAYLLAFNIIGYHYWGLTGLGISFLIGYALFI